MKAPCIRPVELNCSVRNLPKRDELLFQRVLAQPKLSMMGFVCSTRLCRSLSDDVLTSARYLSRILADSVLPEPDSPEMITDWLLLFWSMPMWAAEATAYTCGASSACGCSDILYSCSIASE